MNLLNRSFRYELPTDIVFGVNTVEQLPTHIKTLNGSKVFIVTDPGVVRAGILQKVTSVLEQQQISFEVFSEVDREPDVHTIIKVTEKAKLVEADLVIGVGGGSSLDAAKAIAVMVKNEGIITDYAGLNQIPNPGVPLICIPTTSGTGSEVTIWCVISDKANHRKHPIGGKVLAPTLAVCDPALTLSLPASITAATGLDALTHALECYVNKITQPISMALARESMRLIAKSLRTAVTQADHLEARTDMMIASTMAAMAFNPTRLGLAHALAMPLGGKYNIPHGMVNAIVLPQVMEYNLVSNLEAFKEIAEIFGENTEGLSLREAAALSIKAIRQLNDDIGIPAGLREYGVNEEDLDEIAEEGMESGNILVNPRKAGLEDLKEIVRRSI